MASIFDPIRSYTGKQLSDVLIPFLENLITGTAPVALTDAAVTIQVGAGKWRRMPAATLSANRVITLGTTGAKAGDQITITRLDAGAFTLAIANGGAGAGTLCTLPVSTPGSAVCEFDGTNWHLRTVGRL